MRTTVLLVRLDQIIEERSLLKHPFYQAWQAGALSPEALRLYAAQYYRHVEAFPDHLRVLAGRADGSLRDLILENLADEEDPRGPHPKLWRDFAAAVGVKEETLWSSTPLPGTCALVETYHNICSENSLEEAVAALYAYEAQVPEISTTKIDGLCRFYGVTHEEGLAYFRVHEEADKLHRAAWRSWLKKQENRIDEDRVLATTQSALDALWGVLDAVQGA